MKAYSFSSSNPANINLRAMGLLVIVAAVTACWLTLNFVFPNFDGIRSIVTRLIIHATILIGLWLGLSRTGFSVATRVSLWLAIQIPYTLWLTIVWRLAFTGFFRPIPGSIGVPPLPIAIFAPVLVGLFFLMGFKRVAAVSDSPP